MGNAVISVEIQLLQLCYSSIQNKAYFDTVLGYLFFFIILRFFVEFHVNNT